MKTAAAVTAAAARRRILEVVARIPRGTVTTYGVVAARAGLPRRARLVGQVLRSLESGTHLPWHRVLGAGGRIALPAGSAAHREQLQRLAAEAVELRGGRVDLERHGWQGGRGNLDELLWRPADET